jgi:FtsP/CotA-like multicopper oxidase with cupredoxin domain
MVRMRIALDVGPWGTRARRGVLTIGLFALAAAPASAAPSILDTADAGGAFYCSLHKNAGKATSRSAAARAASGGAQAQAAFARPRQPKWVTGGEFRDPPVLRSKDGVLDVTLRIVRTKVHLGGQLVTATTYNGSYAGPTMRVKLGDTINVKLVNTAGIPDDQPTNLHFHGLHVSPDVPHDNIFVHVEPGHSRRYTVTLGEGNFPGTYWYHSHMHGYSEAQLVNGMSGVIIVEGQREALPKAFRKIKERVLSLKSAQVIDDAVTEDHLGVWDVADSPPVKDQPKVPPNVRLVGAQLQPKISIRPGEVQLWHIANTGANVLYRVELDKSRFTVIAQDANAFDRPRQMKQLFMGGGQRFDVLVTGPPRGTITLRTVGFTPDNGIVAPTRVLASVVSSGKAMKTPPMPTRGIGKFIALDDAPIAARRTFTFGRNGIHADTGFPKFTIDGEIFEEDRIDVRAKLGTVEEWTLVNETGVHPFHMHQNAYQVMSVNGKPYKAHSRVDTFVLPRRPNGAAPTTMVVRVPFETFTGNFVFHCHILGHEDLGMMKSILVEP